MYGRWSRDGGVLKASLEAKGCRVDLQYSDYSSADQIQDLEKLVSKGCKALIVAPVDNYALGQVLAEAKRRGIRVLSYDRLIMDTPAVDCMVAFDDLKIGILQGQYIVRQLGLDRGKGPFNIELFAGSPENPDASVYFSGAMSALRPYIESGRLLVRSGQKDFAAVATQRWESQFAEARMLDLEHEYYGKTSRLDAVLAPNDDIAMGILGALESAGYGKPGRPRPWLTGQDCDLAAVQAVMAGRLSMSVFKDCRDEARSAADLTYDLLMDRQPKYNDTTTYNNGSKVVPTRICQSVAVVDASNYRHLLVDSGYYKESELQ